MKVKFVIKYISLIDHPLELDFNAHFVIFTVFSVVQTNILMHAVTMLID